MGTMVGSDLLGQNFAQLQSWLFEDVLPLWQEQGVDWKRGGFHEKLDADARPIANVPRRTRVVARQIYSFAAAGRLGWTGDWNSVVDHGAQSLFKDCVQPDGLVVSTYERDDAPGNDAFDLYDHAFALFALSELVMRNQYEEQAANAAARMLGAMNGRFLAPKGGWLDAEGGEAILRSNPHMHMLEAMLALDRANASECWIAEADGIVDLALRFFIAPSTGALHEYFDLDWALYPDERGRIVEPGHQFEWSWLLRKWLLQTRNLVADVAVVAEKLCGNGEKYGVTTAGLAIDELWDDLTPKSNTSRTWPQTERVKACLKQAQLSTSATSVHQWEASAAQAINGIMNFAHRTGFKGLWHDRLSPDGRALLEPAPASSLYHIMCAAEVARDYLTESRQGM